MMTIKMVNGIGLKKFLSLIILILLLTSNILNATTKHKPWLGIEFRPLTKEFIKVNNLKIIPSNKLFITNVVKKSPAYLGGIMPGDVILSLNDLEIKNVKNLTQFLSKNLPGTVVKVSLNRNGKKLIKEITLKKYPDKSFKPEWVASINKYKDGDVNTKVNYGLENTLISTKNSILYPNFFQKIFRKVST